MIGPLAKVLKFEEFCNIDQDPLRRWNFHQRSDMIGQVAVVYACAGCLEGHYNVHCTVTVTQLCYADRVSSSLSVNGCHWILSSE